MRNVFIVLALVFSISSGTAEALTTLNVTLSTDNDPGGFGDVGDLRYVLNTMNQDLNTTPDDYAIVFAFPMTIQLNGILPIINNSPNPVSITIGNPGSIPTVTIDGNNTYSGFFIPMGNVTIQNMAFQNLVAKGGDGGDGISGGGGGMGAGGAIYAPQTFLNGSNPSITLMNVSINNSAAIGGNGGNYMGGSSTGNEGGGGGGGFSGNGGSIATTGSTGGGGGGGFGGDGGDVTLSTDDLIGGGGGGGGGLGSRATLGTPVNLGHGGSDQDVGLDGNGYGLSITAGSGGGGNSGGNSGGNNAGGGGGGSGSPAGGGGGGSAGSNGLVPQGSLAPWTVYMPSGGNGGDGGGSGGGAVVTTSFNNDVDGHAANGGYGGGGGGGAGTGASDVDYTVRGGNGGLGGGGGGGGVNQSGQTSADGGSSLGGGGGAGGGPSNGLTANGGSDTGNLGGGLGGTGANTVGLGFGGGGGGGGSGLGGAIFVDSGLNFTLQALSGIPTIFNTSNNTTQAGVHGTGGSGGGSDGFDGSALGNSIFLRSGSSLTFMAQNADDLLTLGEGVQFVDDTVFGVGGTSVFVKGIGTVVYNGTTDYHGFINVNNANFKVNGEIDEATIFVCRNIGFSSQRGTLSGAGTVTGNVFVNSGTIAPDAGATLTLGRLSLTAADLPNNTLGSLVQIAIDSNGTSLVSVTGAASLAGTLQIALDSNATPGSYTILISSAITGTFETVVVTGATPIYSIQYHPTFVEFVFTGFATPVPQFSPGSVDFGTQPIDSAHQIPVTLSNAGNGDLTLNGFSISGAFTATDDCPATLAPNASCTVQITFSPDAVGNYSGVLRLNSNAPGAPAAVTLSGAGAASGHQVTATVADGGGTITPAAVTVAEGQTQTFTVTPAAGYSISSVSGCGGSLSGSTFTTAPILESCSITATFAVVVTAHGKGAGGSMNFLTLGGLLITLLSRCFRRRFRGGVALLLALPLIVFADGIAKKDFFN